MIRKKTIQLIMLIACNVEKKEAFRYNHKLGIHYRIGFRLLDALN